MTDQRFDHEHLREWTEALLGGLGVRSEHAVVTAEVLVASDLQGIESHGVARLPAYAAQLRRGAMAVDGRPEVIRSEATTALVDAHNILGHPASDFAMTVAIERAREFGVGWVAVRNSNHYGIAGYYARQAAEAGFIGITGTNAGSRVAPAGARAPYLGTNPFALAAPTDEPPLFVLDMATSAVSTGKFEIAVREGREIPEGWGVDRHGDHTRDPNDLERGGWLLPLGSFPGMSDHKGYGLALVVEILSALLAGGPYGPGVQNLLFATGADPPRVSHFFCALDPGRFGDPAAFARMVSALLTDLRDLPATDEGRPVVTPGEPEWRHEQRRRAAGIPLIAPVVSSLTALGEQTGVAFPAPAA